MDEIRIAYKTLAFEELTKDDQQLVNEAISALEKAYAPYSNFHVSCAVRDVNGKITTGNNQENAAYPSGLCAERVALFAAKSQSNESLEAMVVMAENEKGKVADAFPCGSCRQVMLEYASLAQQATPIRILMRQSDGRFILLEDVKSLLPFRFDADKLK